MEITEAARYIDALIREHERQLTELQVYRDQVQAAGNSYDVRRELARQVRIHTRWLWNDVQSRSKFEKLLLDGEGN